MNGSVQVQSVRPPWTYVWMTLADALSNRSTCKRAKVGCVIVSDDNQRVLALGYNGGAKGVFNDCMSLEPGQCGHLHAEINALIKCNIHDPSKKILYTTVLPCFNCSVAIINAGIWKVVYRDEYRKTEGKELIEKALTIVSYQEEFQKDVQRTLSLSDGAAGEV